MLTSENPTTTFKLTLRTHRLGHNAQGWAEWQEAMETRVIPAAHCAVIICDMWDNHWSRGAAERVDAMVPRMNEVLASARRKGAHIIHAPSDTMSFYADHPARRRMLEVPPSAPPADRAIDAPPLPIDHSDHGSDTGETEAARVWTRQHAGLAIDPARDVITDQGAEVYSYLRHHELTQLLIMGVHTNMCVLNRSFAIKQMTRWDVPIALVRDLTDTMYNPARSPYVSHDAGTQLVIGYIERFWCPTFTSQELLD